MQIEVMRSQLGRVRGTGAAKAGVHHWYAERLTSLALVPLTVWFVIEVLGHLGVAQPVVAAWIARPWNTVLLLALIFATFHHMQLGLQVVYEDYIDAKWAMNIAIIVTKGACFLLGLAASVAVLRLAFAAPMGG